MIAILSGIRAFEFNDESSEVFWVYIIAFWLIACVLIFNFVVSIVHLTKYPEKGFAIVSLVLSVIFSLLFLYISSIGSDALDEGRTNIDYACKSFCNDIEDVDAYDYEFADFLETKATCYCYDKDKNILKQKEFTLE